MKHYDVVAAVVVHDGKYLCMQKCRTRYAYTSEKWEFPGGKIEQGETPEQALVRELEEEMDYEVHPIKSVAKVEYCYPDFAITRDAWVCESDVCNFNMKEHLDHKWLSKDELSTLDWAAADRKIIEVLVTK